MSSLMKDDICLVILSAMVVMVFLWCIMCGNQAESVEGALCGNQFAVMSSGHLHVSVVSINWYWNAVMYDDSYVICVCLPWLLVS